MAEDQLWKWAEVLYKPPVSADSGLLHPRAAAGSQELESPRSGGSLVWMYAQPRLPRNKASLWVLHGWGHGSQGGEENQNIPLSGDTGQKFLWEHRNTRPPQLIPHRVAYTRCYEAFQKCTLDGRHAQDTQQSLRSFVKQIRWAPSKGLALCCSQGVYGEGSLKSAELHKAKRNLNFWSSGSLGI